MAKRLEKELQIAIADGSFDDLFEMYHLNNKMFEIGQLNQRKVIKLHNPLLAALTPLQNKKLWYIPKSLQE